MLTYGAASRPKGAIREHTASRDERPRRRPQGSKVMKVGFIGLGTMGRHMAANLQKAGHEVVVHDVRREAAESHIKNGARWADSPRAVAEATEVIFASLPEPKDVESVALDEKNGLLSGMTAGKAFFDLAT